MSCEFCRGIGTHDFRCPNYIPVTSSYICSECGNNILVGEEYIINDNGQYAHWECVNYARELAQFLGYDIKEMEGDEDYFGRK